MASCSDLSKLSSTTDCRPIMKATPVPILTSKKLVEPFNRLKNRANLFRRKNYSSQIDISNHRSSLPADHYIPFHPIITTDNNNNVNNNNNLVLKRSNSMICPQKYLQTFFKNNNQHKSINIKLSDCPTDESSTDDYHFIKSSSDRYWNKKVYSKMGNINEQDAFPSQESLNEKNIEEVSLLPNKNNEQTSVILSKPQLTKNVIKEEEEQQLIPSVISSSLIQDNDKTIHSNINFLQQKTLPIKSTLNFDISLSKISTCTMTGKSLNNLDQCLSTILSEDKSIQTTSNDTLTNIKRNNSSTSLSSSTSIQTDSLENKPTIIDETLKYDVKQHHRELYYKWPHIHERLLGEQTCIYWVNYLGSTAIKISNDDTPAVPTQAINRLKQSTQYARILPIIGLSISSRGVEFLKHTKDRVVICFHDIKSIHCACQDQDLRYFAYVTREQRMITGISNPTSQQPTLVSTNEDYHHYCHVFVVKNELMSTEIMLTFGQAFDIAYQLHRRLNSKKMHLDKSHPKIDLTHLSAKSNKVTSSSTHSPATSSSSSSDERRIFV